MTRGVREAAFTLLGVIAALLLMGAAFAVSFKSLWGPFFKVETLPITSLREAEALIGIGFGPEARLTWGQQEKSRDPRAWITVQGGPTMGKLLLAQAAMKDVPADNFGEIVRVFNPALSGGRVSRIIGGPNLTTQVLMIQKANITTAYVYWTEH